MAEAKPKPKIKKEAIEMPKQEPYVRVKNFNEVALGYDEAMALEEASRCLQCVKPQCIAGCPVEVPIPEFIKCIREKKYAEGIAKTQNEERVASSLRSCLPTGRTMPSQNVSSEKSVNQ